MTNSQRLQVILVNFRTPALTIRSVASIRKHGIAGPESITVVENCSGDDSLETMRNAMPDIRIFKSSRNGGFGFGVNYGAKEATSEYLLVLNPDTYFEWDSVKPVLDQMDANPAIGIAGLDLINPDGTRQYGARRFYSALDIAARRLRGLEKPLRGRIDQHLMVAETDKGKPFEADWVMGTGFIARRDLFREIGGLDEDYFLYMEDVDLCARTWAAGRKVVYFPGFPLVHDHQRQSAASPLSFAGRAHLRSLRLFSQRFTIPLFFPPGIGGIVKAAKRNKKNQRASSHTSGQTALQGADGKSLREQQGRKF